MTDRSSDGGGSAGRAGHSSRWPILPSAPRWSAVTGRLAGAAWFPDIVAGSLIGILSWPIDTLQPTIGLDGSWIVGLHVAARDGLAFGADIVFTSGPLGFLGLPQPYLAWTSAAALAFVGGVHILACVVLLHMARRALGAPAALVLVFVSSQTFAWLAGWDLYGVLVFAVAAWALLQRGHRQTGSMFALGLGVAVGFAALGKLNIAAVSLAVAWTAVAASARAPLRSISTFVVTAGVSLVFLWLVARQDIRDLPLYVRGGIDIVLGYSRSMGVVFDSRFDWVAGVAFVATLILAALIQRRSAGAMREDRILIALMFALMIFGAFKADFVRDRFPSYLAILLALWPVVIAPSRSFAAAGVPVAGLLAAFLAVAQVPLTTLVDPLGSVTSMGEQVSTAVFHRHEAASATAASLREAYALPPEAVGLLAGRTVHIEPWDAAIAYAYPEIDWGPLPVFQAYSAYTPLLDELNTERLAGDRAPERILWLTPPDEPLSIDGRTAWRDSPAAKLEMLCRYVPLATGSSWQILGRVPDRCGEPVALGTVTAVEGETVPLPGDLPPGILTVRIHGVAEDPMSRLVTLVYKAPPWYLTHDRWTHRIVLDTAGQPNILGAKPDVGYVGALWLGPPAAPIMIATAEGAAGSDSRLTLEFEVIPVADISAGGPQSPAPPSR